MNLTSDDVLIISFKDMPAAEDFLLVPLIGKVSLNHFCYIHEYYWMFTLKKANNYYYLKDVTILNKGIPLIIIDENKYNEIQFKINLGFSFLELLTQEKESVTFFLTDPSQILTGDYSGTDHV